MKTKKLLTITGLVISVVMLGAMAASVLPVYLSLPNWGDDTVKAYFSDYMYAYKIDNWGDNYPNNGVYEASFPDGHINYITISSDDGYSFDFSATSPIGAVLVKGGPDANVFYYDPQVLSDTYLYAPLNTKTPDPDDTYAISHVWFFWNPEVTEYRFETAFAYGGDYANDFIDNGFHRWGWTNGPITEGTYTWDVYAGAGQSDLSKGTLVGTVTVTYSGGTVTVGWNLNPGIIINKEEVSLGVWVDEIHVYANYGMFPLLENGMPTVAPGQYYVATGLSGPIYVIVQAVVGIPI